MPRRTGLRGHVLAAILACAPSSPSPLADPPARPHAPPSADPPDRPHAPSADPPDPPHAPPSADPPPRPDAPPSPLADAPPVPALTIVDRPITYDAARREKTIEYRRRHQDPAADGVDITPRMIVLHHTGGTSLDATWRYFDRPRVEQGRKVIARAGDLNVSAHFLVDRDGTVVRLMPETWMARHCVGLNHLAIGVENVGDPGRAPLTDAQVRADAALVRDLVARFPGITHLIGHHEYLRFEGHPYFREREPDYRTRKGDPGPAFMARVRAELGDLSLQGPP
jgi:hypothetical protein